MQQSEQARVRENESIVQSERDRALKSTIHKAHSNCTECCGPVLYVSVFVCLSVCLAYGSFSKQNSIQGRAAVLLRDWFCHQECATKISSPHDRRMLLASGTASVCSEFSQVGFPADRAARLSKTYLA